MTLEEAIRINTVLKGAPILKDDPLIIQALNLNIEALKTIGLWNEYQMPQHQFHLPGETQD